MGLRLGLKKHRNSVERAYFGLGREIIPNAIGDSRKQRSLNVGVLNGG